MAKPLVVVESPAKAKTISKFLGDAYDVRASVGPRRRPAVEGPGRRRRQRLQADLRADRPRQAGRQGAAGGPQGRQRAVPRHRRGPRGRGDQLAPARAPQAEDPGEADGLPRDHPAAIDHAVNNPRGIDYGLVDAAETRRILDRLYGYEVSPVLWRRVNRGLSAGRVQSPSIRLIVERERERIAFVVGGLLGHRADDGDVAVVHRRPRRRRRHAGRHRQGLRRQRPARRQASSCSTRRAPVALADGLAERRLHASAPSRRSRTASRPQAPFMTSTLQQEGGRKLRLVVVAGDARRPGPVRARLHHVHAHRQRGAVRRGAARGPRRGGQRVRRAVPVAAAEAVHVEDQERPGGPRGDPPDDAAALAQTRSPAS